LIGELTFDILHCPGHSPGSVVYFNKEMRFAHVGDVLFSGSVGRSDIPGGNHDTLIKSIIDKLLPAWRRRRFHLRPRPGLQHRPGADDQSVPHRRDVSLKDGRTASPKPTGGARNQVNGPARRQPHRRAADALQTYPAQFRHHGRRLRNADRTGQAG